MPDRRRAWTRRDFAVDAPTLARRLLGALLVRTLDDGTRLSGLIVETEAYLGVKDAAAHAYRGRRTPRNESMYAKAGTSYVYFTYGMHHCFNIVCGAEGEPTAVLVRALEPVEGVGRMRDHRLARSRPGARLAETDLCSGPAKLCQALHIDRSLDRVDLTRRGAPLRVFTPEGGPRPPRQVGNGPRVGVAYAGEWAAAPLRWWADENPHVSGFRK